MPAPEQDVAPSAVEPELAAEPDVGPGAQVSASAGDAATVASDADAARAPGSAEPPGASSWGGAREGKLPPPWLQPAFGYPEVVRFGYRFALASRLERGFWLLGFAACLVVLALATFKLSPDPHGIGTHQQLGLPPCGFVEMSGGYPCPSCGYTTTFTLAAHGRPLDALLNQPFGFFVFCLTLAAVPLTALSAFGGVSLFAASERWPWPRLLGGMVAAWLLAWGYKCYLVASAA